MTLLLLILCLVGILVMATTVIVVLIKLDTNEPLYLDEDGNVTRSQPPSKE